MYFFNVNKTPDKALVAACIINQEKCVNELTSISGRPKLYDWKSIRSALLEGWVVCLNQSIWWVKHRLCRLALCGSWHTPPFLQHALAHSPCGLRDEPCASPHTTDRSSADAGGGARFAEAFWQGPSLLYSQSPKLVEYLSYSTSIPHIKSLNRVKAASRQLHGFQDARLGGLVKSLAVSQEEDIAVIQHVNSEALLASFLRFVKKQQGRY